MKKPNQEALGALEDYAKFLREEIAGLKGKDEDPLVGDPIGGETLAQDFKTMVIDYIERRFGVARDPEKWEPVFRSDHAPNKQSKQTAAE